MVNLGMNVDGDLWTKYICERIQEGGRRTWKDGVGAGVRLMVRGRIFASERE